MATVALDWILISMPPKRTIAGVAGMLSAFLSLAI
jgi:hypothetical protein